MPRSYEVTTVILGRRRATQRMQVDPYGIDSEPKSQVAFPENQPSGSDAAADLGADGDS